MILKTIINKNGNYILESVISLPIFLIVVIVLNSIILMYSCIEDANFIAATELRRGAAESISIDVSYFIPGRIEKKIEAHSQVENLSLLEYGYRTSKFGEDELIILKYRMSMTTDNPLNLASKACYDVAAITRAYVGKKREQNNMSEEEMMADGTPVYIFPDSGEKYHNKSCGYLHAKYVSSALSNTIKSKYSSCPLCHSKNASMGTTVYYFPRAGEAYHLSGCPALQRNYIEVEKRVAVERGYSACSKCGG